MEGAMAEWIIQLQIETNYMRLRIGLDLRRFVVRFQLETAWFRTRAYLGWRWVHTQPGLVRTKDGLDKDPVGLFILPTDAITFFLTWQKEFSSLLLVSIQMLQVT